MNWQLVIVETAYHELTACYSCVNLIGLTNVDWRGLNVVVWEWKINGFPVQRRGKAGTRFNTWVATQHQKSVKGVCQSIQTWIYRSNYVTNKSLSCF